MWSLFKKLVSPPPRISAGKAVERAGGAAPAPHQCYTARDPVSRWQGDLYRTEHFRPNSLPAAALNPLWMLATRSCHLVESEGREVKVGHLVYIAVVPLRTWIASQRQNMENAIKTLVKGAQENACFLPASPDHGVDVPFVADFNLIYSVRLDGSPAAARKTAQLSSPFSEHVFQRFSRWFYTVGYEDNEFRSNRYIEQLVQHVKEPPR
ncbi:MAG: hypothetical protein ACREUT_10835 [Steroidobacteraceae bacterium]